VRVAGVARQHILLRHASGQRHVDDVHGQQLGLARVEAALVHVQRGDGLRRDAQRLCGQGAQGGFGVLFGLRAARPGAGAVRTDAAWLVAIKQRGRGEGWLQCGLI
jgi:hypothetical protein